MISVGIHLYRFWKHSHLSKNQSLVVLSESNEFILAEAFSEQQSILLRHGTLTR